MSSPGCPPTFEFAASAGAPTPASFVTPTAAIAFCAGSANAAVETYAIDPVHSAVGFSIRHFVSKVPGKFTKFSGKITVDRDNLEKSSVTARIEIASVETGDNDRDTHLKSPDFFDAAKHPEMTFTSTAWKKTGTDTFDITLVSSNFPAGTTFTLYLPEVEPEAGAAEDDGEVWRMWNLRLRSVWTGSTTGGCWG